jgi:signal transduction histidine kinase
LKYTPADGALSIKAYADDQGRACVEVSDSGPGIPPEDRERVLDRFVRLESSRSSPGTGLGLSLVSAVAKLHQGQIILGDNERGLIVRLMFPPFAEVPNNAGTEVTPPKPAPTDVLGTPEKALP